MISYHLSPPELGGGAFGAGYRTLPAETATEVAAAAEKSVWSPIIWRGGKRLRANFQESRLAVLDFDDGEMTLDGAINNFCDMTHFIGTTRNHQKVKDGKPACDRFRVALFLDRPAAALSDYEYTLRLLAKKYPIDNAAVDGARFFYPCSKIVSINDDGYFHELSRAVVDQLAVAREAFRLAQLKRTGRLPLWVEDFIIRGKLCKNGGRNQTLYAVSKELFLLGYPEVERRQMLAKAPIDWTDFSDAEFLRATRDLNGGST